MLTPADFEARKRRLHQLTLGLQREGVLIGEADDPLLYLERQAYLQAIRDALAGVETARVVLAKALLRMSGNDPCAKPR
jgi:hypothetical protein